MYTCVASQMKVFQDIHQVQVYNCDHIYAFWEYQRYSAFKYTPDTVTILVLFLEKFRK